MKNLVKIHNTGDWRYLLFKYDDKFPLIELRPVYDSIMKEFEDRTGGITYKRFFEDLDKTIWDEYYMNAITLVQMCLRIIDPETNSLNIDLANELIKSFNIRLGGEKIEVTIDNLIESDKKLARIYKSIENRLKIKEVKARQEKENEQKNKIELSWEKMRANIHVVIGVLPKYNCTVNQYLAYNDIKKEIISQRKQANA